MAFLISIWINKDLIILHAISLVENRIKDKRSKKVCIVSYSGYIHFYPPNSSHHHPYFYPEDLHYNHRSVLDRDYIPL
jgi:hypothetical protein